MLRRLAPILLLTTALVSAPLPAKDMNQKFATFGKGSESCRSYMEARVENRREMDRVKQFVFGYLTAFNLMIPQNFNILGDHTMNDVFDWLDAHCLKAPDDNFTNAVAALTQAYFNERKSFKKSTTGWLGKSDSAAESDPLRKPSSPQP